MKRYAGIQTEYKILTQRLDKLDLDRWSRSASIYLIIVKISEQILNRQ